MSRFIGKKLEKIIFGSVGGNKSIQAAQHSSPTDADIIKQMMLGCGIIYRATLTAGTVGGILEEASGCHPHGTTFVASAHGTTGAYVFTLTGFPLGYDVTAANYQLRVIPGVTNGTQSNVINPSAVSYNSTTRIMTLSFNVVDSSDNSPVDLELTGETVFVEVVKIG